MTTTWFTADLHFDHANIIKYCNRPYRDVHEMNEALITNWNSRVQDEDVVHVVGDFGMGSVSTLQLHFDRLNGIKHLYLGNHDKTARHIKGWRSVQPYGEIMVDGQFIVVAHYAHRVFNRSHKGAINLYGHSHGKLPGNSQQLDVGVDCWNYAPVSLPEIQRRLKTLPDFRQEDFHGNS
jgi:calcineurin-like phosphoesterase family protein